jgi:hypothetical protein
LVREIYRVEKKKRGNEKEKCFSIGPVSVFQISIGIDPPVAGTAPFRARVGCVGCYRTKPRNLIAQLSYTEYIQQT